MNFLDLAVIREYCDIHEVTEVLECAAMGLGLQHIANATQVVGSVRGRLCGRAHDQVESN